MSTASDVDAAAAISRDVTGDAAERRPPLRDVGLGLPASAAVFLLLVAVGTIAAVLPTLYRSDASTRDWAAFAILSSCAAIAHLFVVVTPRDQSYHITGVFMVPAIVVLPPELIALTAVVLHVPEWLKVRYPWYIQTFNICNYALSGLAAWKAFDLVVDAGAAPGLDTLWALAGVVVALTFVAVNHTLLAVMLRLARGHSLRRGGLFTPESLLTDMSVTALGFVLATFWLTNPWLITFTLAPLLLIHRSLAVPALMEEARVDPKTGLFNARHFTSALREELQRCARLEVPVSVAMADLDLLRDINNEHGHLAGDAVLEGIAKIFHQHLRESDIPARFGGEEFAILLPETGGDEAYAIVDRIRRAVAEAEFEVPTAAESIRATISIGIAVYPDHAKDANELVHEADVAVYRAKIQGRNRVHRAGSEPVPLDPMPVLSADEDVLDLLEPAPPAPAAPVVPSVLRRRADRTYERPSRTPRAVSTPRFAALSRPLAALVLVVGVAGIGAGVLGVVLGRPAETIGLLTLVALVMGAQALSVDLPGGSISVSAVGILAGAAMFGPRSILPLAIGVVAVHWSSQRDAWYHVVFNVSTLCVAALAATALLERRWHEWIPGGLVVDLATGVLAGAAYYVVNTGLLTAAITLEGHERPIEVWRDRFLWLLPQYIAFGAVAQAVAHAYFAIGLAGLAVFALPLLLMRSSMAAYLTHTARSSERLREAAETIREQNAVLEQANTALRERSLAAMESLSATVDARDSFTAGHSRRVREIALAIGGELGLSQPELDVLASAALFHDIGKLALPDSILLKETRLSEHEWALMREHSDEGARIIERLGFLADAVPSIRHHHERWNGTGYPGHLVGDEIPLGARAIAVADAFDSMTTHRIYRHSMSVEAALRELRRGAGKQFCPRSVTALELAVRRGALRPDEPPPRFAVVS